MKYKAGSVARIYVQSGCMICKEIKKNIKLIRKNFETLGLTLLLQDIDENYEFLAHGFESVPVLMIPFQRPYEAISAEYLIDLTKLARILNGEVPREVFEHAAAKRRREQGITANTRWYQ